MSKQSEHKSKPRRPQYRLYLGKDPHGKRLYKSFTADTLKKAKDAARQWKVLHPASPSDTTLRDACARFLETRSATLSPSTLADYTHRVNYLSILFPDLFKARLAAITTDRLQEVVNVLAGKSNDNNNTKRLSPKTVYNYYSLINAVLESNGLYVRNVRLPQRQRPDLNIPEEEMVKQLIESIKGTSLEIPVLLAALGPMRRGEICGLTMDDIDFDNNIIHVRKSKALSDSGYVIKQPKSSAGNRDIRYPAEVIQLIKEQGYVTNLNPKTLSGNFSRHLQRHNIPHFRFHDLRHYAASFLLAKGVPAVYVKERGGWESDQTMQRYVHALDKQRQQYAQQAADVFQALL